MSAGQRGRCGAKSIAGPDIEPHVWRDIERFLRDPGDILDELSAEREMNSAAAVAEAERQMVLAALNDLALRKQRLLDLVERGSIPPAELEERFAEIEAKTQGLTDRLGDLDAEDAAHDSDVLSDDLLAELRQRLDAGLDDVQRNEIVKLLVRKVTIYTDVQTPRKKQARAVIEYRFPSPTVVNTLTGRRASQNYSSVQRVVAL